MGPGVRSKELAALEPRSLKQEGSTYNTVPGRPQGRRTAGTEDRSRTPLSRYAFKPRIFFTSAARLSLVLLSALGNLSTTHKAAIHSKGLCENLERLDLPSRRNWTSSTFEAPPSISWSGIYLVEVILEGLRWLWRFASKAWHTAAPDWSGGRNSEKGHGMCRRVLASVSH